MTSASAAGSRSPCREQSVARLPSISRPVSSARSGLRRRRRAARPLGVVVGPQLERSGVEPLGGGERVQARARSPASRSAAARAPDQRLLVRRRRERDSSALR